MRGNVRKILGGVAGVLALLYAVLVATNGLQPIHPFFHNEEVLVMAHRGGRGLWPENTMYAFERAAELGVDVLEMDIHSTADGVLVTMHDEAVDRTTDGRGPIHSFTLAGLQALDAGYDWSSDDAVSTGVSFPFRGQGVTVPTLEEIFVAFPHLRMNIEIKQAEPPIVEPFCRLLDRYDRRETVLVGSFHPEIVEDFRLACPGVATSTTEPEVRNFFILNTLLLGAIYRAPADAFQVPEFNGSLRVVSERFVSTAHRHNMEVHVWTVNEEEDMQRLVEMGVDGIITDYPDRLLSVLNRGS